MQSIKFEIVVGTIDSAAKDLELQLKRQEQFIRPYPVKGRSLPTATFPPAPDLTRRRNSALSTTSSTSSFARHPPPPPPFHERSGSLGVSIPRSRSNSAASRSSISKSLLAQREQALLPSAPPEISSPDQDASAPPMIVDSDHPSNPNVNLPQIQIHPGKKENLSVQSLANQTRKIALQDDAYIESLRSRISAPVPGNRSPPSPRIRRRPVSGEIDLAEASAPPLDDDASVSDRVSVVSELPLYTERG